METIYTILATAIAKVYPTIEFSKENITSPKEEFWEYCITVFPFLKTLGKPVGEVTEAIANALREDTAHIAAVNIIGGYVNITFTDIVWKEIFDEIVTPKLYPLKNETIVVDYIGMNVWKPPHIGHICTPLLGQAIINMLRYTGYTVIGDSHLGDWGSLFGKLIVGYEKYGNKELLERDAITHLLDVYVAINADIEKDSSIEDQTRLAFKKLSEGDSYYTNLWSEFTKATIKTNTEILNRMHIHQDYDIGESFYEGISLPKLGSYPDLKYDMNSVVEELLEKGIATKNEDWSVGVVFPEESKLPSTILQKKDWTNLYLTSDLAAIKYRLNNGWNPSKILYFVDVRQSLHFRQVFYIAKAAWWNINTTEYFHAANGAIVLPEGAMSTRKGNIIRLDTLVEEGFNRVKKILEEKWRIGDRALSNDDMEEIAIAAIKYSYLSQDRERDVVFTWDKALSFEGNSGPYIQYAYVRAKKILEWQATSTHISENICFSENDKRLIKMLEMFDKKILQSLEKYKPHILAGYIYELAVAFNNFYVRTPKILEENDTDLKNFRLLLVASTKDILQKWFELLWIQMPEEM